MVGLVGLLDPADDRFTTTIGAVHRELGRDGFISRYSTDVTDDGLSGSEGQFLACSFWLVEALALNGRQAQARELFERFLTLRNDLGLYAEEYDVARGRQVGNFPQAFTHLALISAARVLSGEQAGDTIRAPRAATAPADAGARPASPGEAEAAIANVLGGRRDCGCGLILVPGRCLMCRLGGGGGLMARRPGAAGRSGPGAQPAGWRTPAEG
jgi:hypothetical protein